MAQSIGRLLGTGARAEVFEYGDRVIKLYRSPDGKEPAFREAAIQAAVEDLGLPIPAVWSVLQIDGRWGVVFDRVTEASFADRMRENPNIIPTYIEEMARLHADVHSHTAPQLASLKLTLASKIAAVTLITEERKAVLLNGMTGMPDGDRLCHYDFHPQNILGSTVHPVVIDWPNACRGDPAADVCRAYLIMRLHAEPIAEPYIEAYCRTSTLRRDAIISWLPYVAAGRLTENIAGETDRLVAMSR